MLLNFRKLPSDSSASTTDHSLFPSAAFDCKELMMPPLTMVGENLFTVKR